MTGKFKLGPAQRRNDMQQLVTEYPRVYFICAA